jgi:hypothetical protein
MSWTCGDDWLATTTQSLDGRDAGFGTHRVQLIPSPAKRNDSPADGRGGTVPFIEKEIARQSCRSRFQNGLALLSEGQALSPSAGFMRQRPWRVYRATGSVGALRAVVPPVAVASWLQRTDRPLTKKTVKGLPLGRCHDARVPGPGRNWMKRGCHASFTFELAGAGRTVERQKRSTARRGLRASCHRTA